MATITLNELAYRIYESLRATPSLSDSIDIREIANIVQNLRAKFVKQKIDKYPMAPIDESYVQDLGAVAVNISDSSNHATLDTFRNVMITGDLPLPIETSNGLGLYTRIAPADKLEQVFKLITYSRIPFVGKGKFNQNEIFATQVGKKIMIFSNNPAVFEMGYINVRGVFSNPLEAMEYVTANQTIDQLYDSEYPVNVSMAEDIISTATQMYYNFMASGIKDNVNNEADDAVNINTKKR